MEHLQTLWTHGAGHRTVSVVLPCCFRRREQHAGGFLPHIGHKYPEGRETHVTFQNDFIQTHDDLSLVSTLPSCA